MSLYDDMLRETYLDHSAGLSRMFLEPIRNLNFSAMKLIAVDDKLRAQLVFSFSYVSEWSLRTLIVE